MFSCIFWGEWESFYKIKKKYFIDLYLISQLPKLWSTQKIYSIKLDITLNIFNGGIFHIDMMLVIDRCPSEKHTSFFCIFYYSFIFFFFLNLSTIVCCRLLSYFQTYSMGLKLIIRRFLCTSFQFLSSNYQK